MKGHILMNSRISVQNSSIVIKVINGKSDRVEMNLILKWDDGLDFAEELINACELAKENAIKNKSIAHDKKNY